MSEQRYPVVAVAAYRDELETLAELPPVATLEEAKDRARERGYRVLDEGGNCETSDAFDPERGPVHVVTVEPPPRYGR